MAKAQKPKKEKKEKLKQFKYYGFNIKLRSHKNKGPKAYFDLIQKLYTKDVHVLVGSEKKVTLRTQFGTEGKYKDKLYDILYGFIIRYAVIDGDNWYSEARRDFQKVEIPKDVFPNPYETEYIFFPEVHRFFVKINGRVGVTLVQKFLEDGLKEIIEKDEQITVNIMQSRDVIDEIINADAIQRLNVKVSYTNDDAGSDAQEEMDDLFKEAGIGKADLTFTPDNSGALKEDSTLVKGLLELAKDNGEATATIVSDGQKKRIITKDHPEKIVILSTDEIVAMQGLLNAQMKKNR